jgi:hypothetical protein
MDLNSRVDRIDEEMKLLKNEIKQVLLEVQEHVLNAQNPFNLGGGFASVSNSRPASANNAAGGASGGGAGGFTGGGVINGGGIGVMDAISPAPGAQEPTAGISPGPGLGMAEQLMNRPEEIAPAPEPARSPDSDRPPLGPNVPDSPFDLDSDGPSIGPDGFDADDDFGPSDGFDDDFREPLHDSPATRNRNDAASRKGVLNHVKGDSSRSDRRRKPSREDFEELTTRPERSTDGVSRRRKMEDDLLDLNESLASKSNDSHGSSLDLMTIAGLAQWCDRALKKIGKENLETLVQVSELTGRVNKETKDILMAILPLFDSNKDEVISAKEIVSLLAQLDGLLDTSSGRDNRLLPFILQDDTNLFPFLMK